MDEFPMKRDMDLVRNLLMYFESKPDDIMVEVPFVEGYSATMIQFHLIMLAEAGLVAYEAERTDSGRLIKIYPFRLTWDGHEFLAAARSESNWNKAKSFIGKEAFDIPFSILKELLIRTVKDSLGV